MTIQSFHSLQTGERISTATYEGQPLLGTPYVSIPFKRESASQLRLR